MRARECEQWCAGLAGLIPGLHRAMVRRSCSLVQHLSLQLDIGPGRDQRVHYRSVAALCSDVEGGGSVLRGDAVAGGQRREEDKSTALQPVVPRRTRSARSGCAPFGERAWGHRAPCFKRNRCRNAGGTPAMAQHSRAQPAALAGAAAAREARRSIPERSSVMEGGVARDWSGGEGVAARRGT